jgi:hypothetical protein
MAGFGWFQSSIASSHESVGFPGGVLDLKSGIMGASSGSTRSDTVWESALAMVSVVFGW